MGSHHKDAKLKKVFDPKPVPADGPYRYPTNRTAEFTPLRYDMMAHMKLNARGTRR